MYSPEKTTEMIHSVKPVIQKIHPNDQPEPIPKRGGKLKQAMHPKPLKNNQIHESESQIHATI
jgi:hypothetical protein